jgi:hypothetical protein
MLEHEIDPTMRVHETTQEEDAIPNPTDFPSPP